jgi:hypothetical protein
VKLRGSLSAHSAITEWAKRYATPVDKRAVVVVFAASFLMLIVSI